ncbi:aromatic ring-hydroxylating dioxygenase subunit alpha [Paracoccus sp. 1_MG-2023]|uniref:aromatic ring-hydroxylating oxygenase subunit alpha n=1 Tax=unclassified Paracoccus (in: a-proteobacteria) TaxID=2688777 RepID=UPI001C080BAB|nr:MULTISPECIES: aromatic ring-hydroxylating dioxygenase subunit alpha [unclassified Paracoccus (in: a-proteobacteria)]MBU2957785.1 aromatic ring-hydroxylating dioxygenase subunit alpha [Paracoccus sp. C2R09]MDO6667367.1 aromatic ring-hydroxylating dioxygenase subunit alpha [Paracoccus sp. 1_MG-2023]
MTNPTPTAQLIAQRQAKHSLPRDLYCSETTYRDDLEMIWYREWLFAGPAAELPKTGSFTTMQVGEYPVIVTRGADGRVRAFHNVCRHRGQRLCATASGTNPKLVCPYHQWTYDLDGKLIFARDMGPDFDPSKYGLKPVHCVDIAGLIFICLAKIPPPINEMAAQIMRYVGPHGLKDARIAHSSTIVERGNWKLVIENNRECYHCGGSHPSLCRTYSDDPSMTAMEGPDSASPEIIDHWKRCEGADLPSRFVHHPQMQWRLARIPLLNHAESYTLSGKAAVRQRMGTVPFADAGALLFFNYPNTWNHFLADHSVVFRVVPIGPTETQVTTHWLVHKDAVEGVDYDLADLTHVWMHTNDEDRIVVEENQAGILSPAYEPGPYSTLQEEGVIQFTDWYCATMAERLGPQTMAAE